jgi:hypothetical protein
MQRHAILRALLGPPRWRRGPRRCWSGGAMHASVSHVFGPLSQDLRVIRSTIGQEDGAHVAAAGPLRGGLSGARHCDPTRATPRSHHLKTAAVGSSPLARFVLRSSLCVFGHPLFDIALLGKQLLAPLRSVLPPSCLRRVRAPRSAARRPARMPIQLSRYLRPDYGSALR